MSTAHATFTERSEHQDSRAGVRKVTYSLPAQLVADLGRRAMEMAKSKSAVVAEALAVYFAERDRLALAEIYQQAAIDPAFQADNEAVLRDFDPLDLEAAGAVD